MSGARERGTWLPMPQALLLEQACAPLWRCFPTADHVGVYLVGSALERRDFRDVDVRMIMSDADYDRIFPGAAGHGAGEVDPFWSVFCAGTSLLLSRLSGFPIVDFQVQRMTQANAANEGKPRNPIGMYIYRDPPVQMP